MATLESRRAKILIVDNNPADISLIARALPADSVKLIATCASKAMEILLNGTELPNLVILDTTLARFDNDSICHSLRADPRLATLPVILIGNRPAELDPLMRMGCGVDFILRPFSPEDIALPVEVQLQTQEIQRELCDIQRDPERIIHARAKDILDFQILVRSILKRLLDLCPQDQARQ